MKRRSWSPIIIVVLSIATLLLGLRVVFDGTSTPIAPGIGNASSAPAVAD